MILPYLVAQNLYVVDKYANVLQVVFLISSKEFISKCLWCFGIAADQGRRI